MNPLDLLVKKLDLQSDLPEADRAAILAMPVTLRMIEPSTYVLREGEHPTRCGVIVSGYAYRHKLTVEGARQIVGLHVGGDPLDFQTLFLDVADHNVQTLTRAEIAFVDRAELQHLVETRPAVARAVLINVLVEASILREWVLNIGRRDAAMRLAHLLCEMTVRLAAVGLASDDSFELPMTQEQLGDALGLTPVHVNRTLKALESEGLIRRSKRLVVSRDWTRLRERAGFNNRYLHLERQALSIAA